MLTLNRISPTIVPTISAIKPRKLQPTRFGADTVTKDPIEAMPEYELVSRKVAISWSKPTGVEKELKRLSNTIDEKQNITFPYLLLAAAPFILASFLMMPWLGFLGLPLTIYALYRLRKGHQRLDKAMRQQYRALTDKLNIQPDFPLPYKGGPLPTKPAVTA